MRNIQHIASAARAAYANGWLIAQMPIPPGECYYETEGHYCAIGAAFAGQVDEIANIYLDILRQSGWVDLTDLQLQAVTRLMRGHDDWQRARAEQGGNLLPHMEAEFVARLEAVEAIAEMMRGESRPEAE